MKKKLTLGVSACLLGEKTRYDGTHRRDPLIIETLGEVVNFVAVCPEVECGFGIPRETLALRDDPACPRLVTVATKKDCTQPMLQWARKRTAALEKEDLAGFIFKSRSPSCGLHRVKVFQKKGKVITKGVGLFARMFREHFPLLPVTDENKLHDPRACQSFLEKVLVMRLWQEFLKKNPSRAKLLSFHAKQEPRLRAQGVRQIGAMEGLLGKSSDVPLQTLIATYQALLAAGFRLKPTS